MKGFSIVTAVQDLLLDVAISQLVGGGVLYNNGKKLASMEMGTIYVKNMHLSCDEQLVSDLSLLCPFADEQL